MTRKTAAISNIAGVAALIAMIVFVGYGLWQIAATHSGREMLRTERCKKFRREFFESCLAAEPRYRCEVQWTQLGGKVFDSDPAAAWSDQVDCSGYF